MAGGANHIPTRRRWHYDRAMRNNYLVVQEVEERQAMFLASRLTKKQIAELFPDGTHDHTKPRRGKL